MRLGESLAAAVRREMREETGLTVTVGELVAVYQRLPGDGPASEGHFVVLDYLCAVASGEPAAGDDADAVGWFALHEIAALRVTEGLAGVLRAARRMASRTGRSG